MLTKKSILLVEDNAFVSMDLAFAVEQLNGCVVGPAATTTEALALIERHALAGAVLDCDLADRDVTPVALLLADMGVPIILHTGTGPPAELLRAIPDVTVIPKPLASSEVVRILAKHIEDSAAPLIRRT